MSGRFIHLTGKRRSPAVISNTALYTISRKTNDPNTRKWRKTSFWEKPHFGPDLGPLGPNSGRLDFFLKNLGSSVPRYHSQLSSCTKSEKTNDRILRKLSDGRTYGRTDGRTESDFHRTLSY